eukprot:m.1633318 g.1633318  ORF g.1633318 m.1633318 type:complete len:4716 (+) comp25407_c0_seq2:166-14313(+)
MEESLITSDDLFNPERVSQLYKRELLSQANAKEKKTTKSRKPKEKKNKTSWKQFVGLDYTADVIPSVQLLNVLRSSICKLNITRSLAAAAEHEEFASAESVEDGVSTDCDEAQITTLSLQGILTLLDSVPNLFNLQPTIAVRMIAGFIKELEALPPGTYANEAKGFFDDVSQKFQHLAAVVPPLAGICHTAMVACVLARGNFTQILQTALYLVSIENTSDDGALMPLPTSLMTLRKDVLESYFRVRENGSNSADNCTGTALGIYPSATTVLNDIHLPASADPSAKHVGGTERCAIATDGQFMFVQNTDMLYKISAGRDGSDPGSLVDVAITYPPLPEGSHVDLCFVDGALVRYVAYPPGGNQSATLEVLDPRTLQPVPTQYQLSCPAELEASHRRSFLTVLDAEQAVVGVLQIEDSNVNNPGNGGRWSAVSTTGGVEPWCFQRYRFDFQNACIVKLGPELSLQNAEVLCQVHGHAPWLARDPAALEKSFKQLVTVDLVSSARLVLMLTQEGMVYAMQASGPTGSTDNAASSATTEVGGWHLVSIPRGERIIAMYAAPTTSVSFALGVSGRLFKIDDDTGSKETSQSTPIAGTKFRHPGHKHELDLMLKQGGGFFGGGWTCDVCNAGAPTTTRYRCSACDWDSCDNCMQKVIEADRKAKAARERQNLARLKAVEVHVSLTSDDETLAAGNGAAPTATSTPATNPPPPSHAFSTAAVGASVCVAVDSSGIPWVGGAVANRLLPWIPPRGALVEFAGHQPMGIRYADVKKATCKFVTQHATGGSQRNPSVTKVTDPVIVTRCDIEGDKIVVVVSASEATVEEPRIVIDAKEFAPILPPVKATVKGAGAAKTPSFTLTFSVPMEEQEDKPNIGYRHGKDYLGVVLFHRSHMGGAIVAASVDVERCRTQQMDIETYAEGGFLVKMRSSGPRTIISSESTDATSPVIRWKVANLGGNSAFELGVVPAEESGSNVSLHGSGCIGICSNVAGSVLPKESMSIGEYVEITVDAEKREVTYVIDDRKTLTQQFDPKVAGMANWQYGQPLKLALTLWNGGSVHFADIGQEMPIPEPTDASKRAKGSQKEGSVRASRSRDVGGSSLMFVPVTSFKDKIQAVACGDEHCCVLTEGGHAYTFGSNAFGQCGLAVRRKERLQDKPDAVAMAVQVDKEPEGKPANADAAGEEGGAVLEAMDDSGDDVVERAEDDSSSEESDSDEYDSNEESDYDDESEVSGDEEDADYFSQSANNTPGDGMAKPKAHKAHHRRPVQKDADNFVSKPVLLHAKGLIKPIQHVTCGGRYTVVIDAGNRIWTCGEAADGQLGRSIDAKPAEPKPDAAAPVEGDAVAEADAKLFCARLKLAHTLPEGFRPKSVKAGNGHTVILGHCGTVFSFGLSSFGQCGVLEANNDAIGAVNTSIALRKWSLGLGLVSHASVWDRTTVLFLLHQAIDLRNGGVIDSVYACDADSLTVLGRNPVPDDAEAGTTLNDSRDQCDGADRQTPTIVAATFPLVDCSLCVARTFAGDPVSTTFDHRYQELWAFDAGGARVRRHDAAGRGVCNATALPATLPLEPGTVAAPSNVGLALASLVGMAALLENSDVPSTAGSQHYYTANRFKSHTSKHWNVSGSADAIAIRPSHNVTLVGVGLYGKGASVFDVNVEVYGASSGVFGSDSSFIIGSESFRDMTNAPGTDWYPCEFSSPIDLVGGNTYDVVAKIDGRGGADACSGSRGITSLVGPDGTSFTIKDSTKSVNGTSSTSGQLPVLLYRTNERPAGAQSQPASCVAMALGLDKVSPTATSALGSLTECMEWALATVQAEGTLHARSHLGAWTLTVTVQLVQWLVGKWFCKDYQGALTSAPKKTLTEKQIDLVLQLRVFVLNSLQLARLQTCSTTVRETVFAAVQEVFGHFFNVFFPTRDLQLSILYNGIQSTDARARRMLKATLVALQRNQQRTLDLFANSDDDITANDIILTDEEFGKALRRAPPEVESAIKNNFTALNASTSQKKYNKYLKSMLKKDMYVGEFVNKKVTPAIASGRASWTPHPSNNDLVCVRVGTVHSLESGGMLVQFLVYAGLSDEHDRSASSSQPPRKTRPTPWQRQTKLSQLVLLHPDEYEQAALTARNAAQAVAIHPLHAHRLVFCRTIEARGGMNTDIMAALQARAVDTSAKGMFQWFTDSVVHIASEPTLAAIRMDATLGHSDASGDLDPAPSDMHGDATNLLTALMQHIFVQTSEDDDSSWRAQLFAVTCCRKMEDILGAALGASRMSREQLASILENAPLFSKFLPLLTMFVSMSLADTSGIFCNIDVRDINETIRSLLRKVNAINANFPLLLTADTTRPTQLSNACMMETTHPYSRPTRDMRSLDMGPDVHYVTLQFDPRCSTLQPEDYIVVSVPADSGATNSESQTKLLQCSGSSHQWPTQEAIVIPGSKVNFEFCTASKYVEGDIDKEKEKAFGYRCIATGYTMDKDGTDAISTLESDLVMLSTTCCAKLLQFEASSRSAQSARATKPSQATVPLKWSSRNKSKHIELSNDDTVATRTSSYQYGVCVTDAPLTISDGNSFKIKLTRYGESDWAGSLAIGLLSHQNVSSGTSTASSLKPEVWYVNGGAVHHNGSQVKDGYSADDQSLQTMGKDDEIEVVIDSSGQVSYFFNSRDAGVAFVVPASFTEVYPFVDLYGKAVAVEITAYSAAASPSPASALKSTRGARAPIDVSDDQLAAFGHSPLAYLEHHVSASNTASSEPANVHAKFLDEFVQVKRGSSGGRLAAWLFGKAWVSVPNCHVTVQNQVVKVREAVSFVLETRNCADERIYDKDLLVKIEGTAWKPQDTATDQSSTSTWGAATAAAAKLSSVPVGGHFEDLNNGTYKINWKQGTVGTYQVSIRIDGTDVPGSPFQIQVEDATTSTLTSNTLSGLSLDAASTGSTPGEPAGASKSSLFGVAADTKGSTSGRRSKETPPPFSFEGVKTAAGSTTSPFGISVKPGFSFGSGGKSSMFGSSKGDKPSPFNFQAKANVDSEDDMDPSSPRTSPVTSPKMGANARSKGDPVAGTRAGSTFGTRGSLSGSANKDTSGNTAVTTGPAASGFAATPVSVFNFGGAQNTGADVGTGSALGAAKTVSFNFTGGAAKTNTTDDAQPSGAEPAAAKDAPAKDEQEQTAAATGSAAGTIGVEGADGAADGGDGRVQAGTLTSVAAVPLADLSTNDALVLRIVFAAILRQESLLDDAIMCSTYLKFGSQTDGAAGLSDADGSETTESAVRLRSGVGALQRLGGGSPMRTKSTPQPRYAEPDKEAELCLDMQRLRSRVVQTHLEAYRKTLVCPTFHPMTAHGKFPSSSYTCAVCGKTHKRIGSPPPTSCTTCSLDVCHKCAPELVASKGAHSSGIRVTGTYFALPDDRIAPMGDDDASKAPFKGSLSVDTKSADNRVCNVHARPTDSADCVGVILLHKTKVVFAVNEATDSAGSVWLQLARSVTIDSAVGDQPVPIEYSGALWVKFCGPDCKPQFKKVVSFHTTAKLSEKCDFLMSLEAKNTSLLEYTGEEANDLRGLAESAFVRLEEARHTTSEEEHELSSAELARRLSLRDGGLTGAPPTERSGTAVARMSSGVAEDPSAWSRARTAVFGSSVSLKAVLENSTCELGKDLVQFLHSAVSAQDAMSKSAQLRQSLAVHCEAIETFTELLLSVSSYTALHSVLWAVATLPGDVCVGTKGNADGGYQGTLSAVRCTPLHGLPAEVPNVARLRKAFHRLLLVVLRLLKLLPHHDSMQHAAIRCWALNFQDADFNFLHHNRVFTEISNLIAVHDGNGNRAASTSPSKDGRSSAALRVDTPITMRFSEDVTSAVEITVSSRPGMQGSLIDGKTDTFWESDGGDNHKKKYIYTKLPAGLTADIVSISCHIDNTRDRECTVKKIALVTGGSEGALLDPLATMDVDSVAGWYTVSAKRALLSEIVGVEIIADASKRVRVRQVCVYTSSSPSLEKHLDDASHELCRGDALFVFQHMTQLIFQNLLETSGDSDATATAAADPGVGDVKERRLTRFGDSLREESMDLQQHVVSLMSTHSDTFTTTQQGLTRHMVDELHLEAMAYGSDVDGGGAQRDDDNADEAHGNDDYTFQLLSMISSLLASADGGSFIGRTTGVVYDLARHLVHGTPRVQRQVLAVLTKLLPLLDMAHVDGLAETPDTPLPLVPTLLYALAGSLTLQVRCKGQPSGSASDVSAAAACSSAREDVRNLFSRHISKDVAAGIITLLHDFLANGTHRRGSATVVKAALQKSVEHVKTIDFSRCGPEQLIQDAHFWRAMAALCLLQGDIVEAINSTDDSLVSKHMCDNHDDGVTAAEWHCAKCDMHFCSECDAVMHLPQVARTHERTALEMREPSLQVDSHEGLGRARLPLIVMNANSRDLKCLVEFKRQSKGASCRFCADDISTLGPLANLNKCGLPNVCNECVDVAKLTCVKTLSCGHACHGLRNEEHCLPCLYDGCVAREGLSLHQDREDECFCYTGNLGEEPCIQLHCGHIMHHQCIIRILQGRWNGPRIDFAFARCPICRTDLIDGETHPALQELMTPIRELHADVRRKSLMRLEYDGSKIEGSESEKAAVAMKKYAYYICYKCNKSYFGGEQACAAAATHEYDPSELVCGACVGGTAAQVCSKHGTDYLEYKCRFCCSVAVYFCFGTTHFCNPCHDEHSRCCNAAVEDLPHCPAGPKLTQLEGEECPLHIWHPPTGEEFALGCGLCRNAQTF